MSNSLNTFGLLLAPGLPLAMALLWAFAPLRPTISRWAHWAPLPALVLALFGRSGETAELSWLLLGSSLGLTPISQVFLFFTALIWLAAGLYGHSQNVAGKACERYCIFWLLTLTGNLTLILAQDVPLFYTSFALMTFAAYGLIVYHGTLEALYAGRVYLVLAVLGEALILLGLLLAARAAPTPLLPLMSELPAAIAGAPERDLIIASLWLGFGIKAGLPLLHFSLPLAYAAAPIPAASVLAGAMIKAGLLGWLVTLPLGASGLVTWGQILFYTGLFAMFAGVLIGINQKLPQVVLAYSSISQMGAFSLALGVWLWYPELGPAITLAIVIYALHHALNKAVLFLGVDAVTYSVQRRRLLWLALALPALALAGLLPSGLLAKDALKTALDNASIALPNVTLPDFAQLALTQLGLTPPGLTQTGLTQPGLTQPDVAQSGNTLPWASLDLPLLPLLLSLGALGTTLLMARYLWLLRLDAASKPAAPRALWLSWGLLLLASVFAVFLLPWWGFDLAGSQAIAGLSYALWPIGAGILLALVARFILRPIPIPSADILPLLTPIPRLALRLGITLGLTGPALGHGLSQVQGFVQRRYRRAEIWFGRASEHLWRRDAALLFAVLLAILALANW